MRALLALCESFLDHMLVIGWFLPLFDAFRVCIVTHKATAQHLLTKQALIIYYSSNTRALKVSHAKIFQTNTALTAAELFLR